MEEPAMLCLAVAAIALVAVATVGGRGVPRERRAIDLPIPVGVGQAPA